MLIMFYLVVNKLNESDIEHALFDHIYPIHRFMSSDWLKEGHMTWISFDNVHVRKLIHVC